MNDDELVDGAWYWVSNDGSEWWPALRDDNASNGWTNADTWEDFDSEVKFWHFLPSPELDQS